ncbi:MAG: double zinc ribbon domain-containing protein [Caldilinea sp.]
MMSPELINTIGTIVGVLVAALGAFLFAFWIAMGIWTFNDIRSRTRDWLVITLAVALTLIFPLIGFILYLMIRPKATLAEVYDRALEEEALLRELEETMTCHHCGIPVNEAWVYCPNCHSQLQHSCPNCGKLVRNEWEICVFCASAIDVIIKSRHNCSSSTSTYLPETTPATSRQFGSVSCAKPASGRKSAPEGVQNAYWYSASITSYAPSSVTGKIA